MDLFRTETLIETKNSEKLDLYGWKKISPLRIQGGLILTNLSDVEHDEVMNIHDKVDQSKLADGITAALHVENRDCDDPHMIDLLTIPERGQILRHQDKFYLVTRVLQSSNYNVAVFAKKLIGEEFEALKFDVAEPL